MEEASTNLYDEVGGGADRSATLSKNHFKTSGSLISLSDLSSDFSSEASESEKDESTTPLESEVANSGLPEVTAVESKDSLIVSEVSVIKSEKASEKSLDLSEESKDFSEESSSKSCNQGSDYSLSESGDVFDTDPFVYDGRSVRYNVEQGVDPNAIFIIGSRKRAGIEGERGYRSVHFSFNPKSGTLNAGCNIDNGWRASSNFSLISGIGNSSELDASFISGAHNKIVSEACSDASETDDSSFIPSCAIIGGRHNIIRNDLARSRHSSVIVGCSGVDLRNCKNTVVLGVKRSKQSTYFEGFQEATITDKLYTLGVHRIGLLNCEDTPKNVVLDVNGNALIRGHLKATAIVQQEVYVEGNDHCTSWVLNRGDGINVIYVNPIHGPVDIQLGTCEDPYFEPNRVIVIKDVTPEFTVGCSHNVGISVPETSDVIPTRIEHYGNCGNGTCLTASVGGTYGLNSSGGSVTLRYMHSPVPGAYPTWVIENQFIGNPRLLTSTGVTFTPACHNARRHVLKRK